MLVEENASILGGGGSIRFPGRRANGCEEVFGQHVVEVCAPGKTWAGIVDLRDRQRAQELGKFRRGPSDPSPTAYLIARSPFSRLGHRRQRSEKVRQPTY